MGKVLYEPVLKDGHQLVNSKSNPDRVRGLSRDENNKNPDIPEFNVVKVGDSFPEQVGNFVIDSAANALAALISAAVIKGTDLVVEKYAVPWVEEKAIPKIKEFGSIMFHVFKGDVKIKAQELVDSNRRNNSGIINKRDVTFEDVNVQIDTLFTQQYYDMDEKELNQHILTIIHNLLCIANEMQTISNARIKIEDESEEQYEIAKKKTEDYLIQKVSDHLDSLMSSNYIKLDAETSDQVENLLGGGIINNNEYVPVNQSRVKEAMLLQKDSNGETLVVDETRK